CIMCVLNVEEEHMDQLLRLEVFFFQAEDGIRDRNVTGVQTCALPIYDRDRCRAWLGLAAVKRITDDFDGAFADLERAEEAATRRSEERRVGKECRSRRWREP